MDRTHRRLMWHGMLLFLIGLLTNFAETHFANMRMGLGAHLKGVMNFPADAATTWPTVAPDGRGDCIVPANGTAEADAMIRIVYSLSSFFCP